MEIGDFVVLDWRAVCGRSRAWRRGQPWYCFDTFNASQPMTLADGTELTPALGTRSPIRPWYTSANAPGSIRTPTPRWSACLAAV